MSSKLRFLLLAVPIALVAATFAFSLFPTESASANGLSMAPLKYQTNLQSKAKKGIVDITNSSGFTQNIKIKVRAFKQIDNKGTLQFYEDPVVSAGIIPDYRNFRLEPHQSIHLYFLLDGRKLPKKRIFAAILAQAQPAQSSYNITPVLRVGTLLILKNGNGDPPKQGSISSWRVSLFQFGKQVNGSFDFKNIEKSERASGYFPEFRVRLDEVTKRLSGNLVFPGIKRTQTFSISGNRIGVYKLKLTSDANTNAEQWIVVVTGYWRWLLPVSIALVLVLMIAGFRLQKHRKISWLRRKK